MLSDHQKLESEVSECQELAQRTTSHSLMRVACRASVGRAQVKGSGEEPDIVLFRIARKICADKMAVVRKYEEPVNAGESEE